MEQLTTHMLTAEFFKYEPFTARKTYHNKPETQKIQQKVVKDYYDIVEDDKLFWAFYIIRHGYEEYSQVKRTFSNEKQLKFSMIEELKDEKQYLKQNKIRLSLLVEDLGTSHTISLPTFIGLCCAYRKNICVFRNKIMARYAFDESTVDFHVVDCNNKHLSSTKKNDTILENKYVIVTNLDKPLKDVTSYKKEELQIIASKFGVSCVHESTKKQKMKQQLYQDILENI